MDADGWAKGEEAAVVCQGANCCPVSSAVATVEEEVGVVASAGASRQAISNRRPSVACLVWHVLLLLLLHLQLHLLLSLLLLLVLVLLLLLLVTNILH